MASASNQGGVDSLAAGWAELRAGRWDSASACFERALAVHETPQAAEGLSWAAWWRDDFDVVFAARRRAYRLYRQQGDVVGAARMATWLACDQLDFSGAVAVAAGWLARAHRLLEHVEPSPEHGWLAFFDGYVSNASGDMQRASRLASETADLGRRFGVPDLQMLGLALQGAALVAGAEVDKGMRLLDEATALALEDDALIPISAAWTCCFLVTACSGVRDYDRAVEWCDRIAEFAGRYGSRYMLAFCRSEYGAVHLWRGRWAEADRLLQESVEDFSRSRPAMVGAPLATLAELRRRQGRAEEAVRLLDRAGPSTAALLCHARLALDRGDALDAGELAERLLRRAPSADRLQQAPVLELLVRSHVASGRVEAAESALRALREIEEASGARNLRASGDLVAGMLAAAAGDHEGARRLLEDAVDSLEGSGGWFEAAEARMELAVSLLALGRLSTARREAAVAHDRLLELGAIAAAERARQIRDASGDDAAQTSLRGITPREREVLRLLAGGLTNRQIAERLVVSEHTVHRHVSNILHRLELPSRTAAAAHAVRCGLLDPPSG